MSQDNSPSRTEPIDILLVEDNPDDVELAIMALRKSHLANNIFVVRDGEEALDFLFCRGPFGHLNPDHPPKVVLLDIKLPKVDGLEVLKEIKSNPKTKAIPVVALTSSKQQQDMVEGYHLGVNSYIQKPVDFAQFTEIVKQLGFYWLIVNEPPPKEAFTTPPSRTS